MFENNKGVLLVVSGPSGVGKGTVCSHLVENNKNIFLSVSATTRKPRKGEVDGQSYFFYDIEKFKNMIDNDGLLEWACFCDNYYGTPLAPVEKSLQEGKDIILEIDQQGALNVKNKIKDAVLIFVFPPSMEVLKERLCGRGTETPEVIEKRLKTAQKELEISKKYDYFVVNDTVENAAKKIEAIITAEKLKSEKCKINIK